MAEKLDCNTGCGDSCVFIIFLILILLMLGGWE